MEFLRLLLLLTSYLCTANADLHRRTSALSTQYLNTSSTSTSSSRSTTTNALCSPTSCAYGEPQDKLIEFNWPIVSFTPYTAATVIYKVNPEGQTSTITEFADSTVPASVIHDEESFYNSLLSTTGITVDSNGIPALTFEATVWTAPDASITVPNVLTSPTGYFNMNWLYYTMNLTSSPGAPDCETDSHSELFALTPTATPPGYANPYYAPVDQPMWSELVPSSIRASCSMLGFAAPESAVNVASALTVTSTQYDSYVHSSSSQAAGPTPAGNAKGSSPPPSTPPATNSAPKVTSNPGGSQQPASPVAAQQTPAQNSAGNAPSQDATKNDGSGTTSPGNLVIGSQTLVAGSSAVTVSGIAVSLAPAPPATANAASSGYGSLILSGLGGSASIVAPSAAGSIVIGSQTLTAGGSGVTVSGTVVSLATSGSALVIGSHTVPLSQAPGITASAAGARGAVVVNGQTITSGPSGPSSIVIAGQTITAGASAITISGTRVSLAPSGTALVIGSQTLTPGASGISLAGSTISLAPGAPAASGPSGGSSDNLFVINGLTVALSAPAITINGLALGLTLAPVPAPLGSPGGAGASSSSEDLLIIGTQTITPGAPAVTVSGNVVSLAPGASDVVINGQTVSMSLFTPPPGSVQSITGSPGTTTDGGGAAGGLTASSTSAASGANAGLPPGVAQVAGASSTISQPFLSMCLRLCFSTFVLSWLLSA